MVVVAGMWEMGWNTPMMEVDLWKYPMRDFQVDEFAMTPVSGIQNKSVKEFASIDDIIKHYHLPLIVVDERGTTNLADFEHPKSALYLFGKAGFSPLSNYFKIAESLKIETPRKKGGLLWAHQAASVVLYDRYKKSWQ